MCPLFILISVCVLCIVWVLFILILLIFFVVIIFLRLFSFFYVSILFLFLFLFYLFVFRILFNLAFFLWNFPKVPKNFDTVVNHSWIYFFGSNKSSERNTFSSVFFENYKILRPKFFFLKIWIFLAFHPS